jgi:hypothetical protein
MLKDKENADRLKALLLNVVGGKAIIYSSDFAESVAEIALKS